MFKILTAQQRNPAGERTINAITKNLGFRYHTKTQVPTQYCERIEYIKLLSPSFYGNPRLLQN